MVHVSFSTASAQLLNSHQFTAEMLQNIFPKGDKVQVQHVFLHKERSLLL